ncbi:MAG: hypothetical protein H6709_04950 [Kofleriaceae bacterium]|nr:hypothetical protein [Myxococcales bacterium]MCB9559808.1 hypothetical protein [Kofleriaceae bacterium]MCB9571419.1 hypothetical protein [Kofleriaceae bacterium]
MKAIKFVILGAGLLGLLSFFLPLVKGTINGETLSFSAGDVMKGVDLAQQGVKQVKDSVTDDISEVAPDAKQSLKDLDDALDTIKGIVILFFAPSFFLFVIGGVGALRKKLGRLGGVGALLIGALGAAMSGFVIAVLSDPGVKEVGFGPGLALYLLMVGDVAAVVCGLLTLIKPDRGGKFA